MRCRPTPRLFVWNWNFGLFNGFGSQFWQSTVDRWHKEGLPEDVDTVEKINRYMGADRYILHSNVHQMPVPKEKIINVEGSCQLVETGFGREIVRRFKGANREMSMDEHIKYPVSNRKDWLKLKSFFDAGFGGMYANLSELFTLNYDRCGVGGLMCGSLYGWMRNWFGLENLSYMLYDDEKLISEILEYMTEYFIDVVTRSAAYIPHEHLQFFHFWEDMASKNGSLISPAMYKRLMVPYYKQIVEHCRKLYPEAVITLDSDGNVEELVPIWLDCGITCIFPCEAAAGMDVVRLKKEYGRDLQLIGGIDKRKLAMTRDDIVREVERVLPAFEMGGYLPNIDHSVPPDISFDNYMFYKELLEERCNEICRNRYGC